MSIENKLIHLPEADRPRERFMHQGAEALSTMELLAILLGSGIKSMPVQKLAQELLMHFGSLPKLSQATISELRQIKGIGEAKAIQIKAAFTLGTRAACSPIKAKSIIQTPLEAYQLIKEILASETRELFLVILQDVKRQLICHEVVAIGTLTRSLVHPREVFYPAIRHKAASMIIAHNHPSGDLTPSFEDRKVTQTLIKVGTLIGIPVDDHLIVSASGYLSFRQRGICF